MKMTTILEQWHYQSVKKNISVVLPDGCRDFIWKIESHRSQYIVTELDNHAYFIEHNIGCQYIGYRFYPGTVIQYTQLNDALKKVEEFDNNIIITHLNEHTYLNDNIAEALQSLSEYCPIRLCAKHLGVSQRTLERLVDKYTQRSPVYWRNLARVRKTAAWLISTSTQSDQALADVAITFHFSDQAHMTREFKLWFGVSPKQFKYNKQLYHSAFATGYN